MGLGSRLEEKRFATGANRTHNTQHILTLWTKLVLLLAIHTVCSSRDYAPDHIYLSILRRNENPFRFGNTVNENQNTTGPRVHTDYFVAGMYNNTKLSPQGRSGSQMCMYVCTFHPREA